VVTIIAAIATMRVAQRATTVVLQSGVMMQYLRMTGYIARIVRRMMTGGILTGADSRLAIVLPESEAADVSVSKLKPMSVTIITV
jgi:hypothetical protein